MDEIDQIYDRIYKLAAKDVCPNTSNPTTPYENGMVDRLTNFGLEVMRSGGKIDGCSNIHWSDGAGENFLPDFAIITFDTGGNHIHICLRDLCILVYSARPSSHGLHIIPVKEGKIFIK